MGEENNVVAKAAKDWLGGMVVFLLPVVLIGAFDAWLSVRDLTLVVQRNVKSIEKLERFRTEGKRFTDRDGIRLETKQGILEQEIDNHLQESEQWKRRILRNESDIKELIK